MQWSLLVFLKEQGSVFSFNIKNIHSHDVSTIFDQEEVAVEEGIIVVKFYMTD